MSTPSNPPSNADSVPAGPGAPANPPSGGGGGGRDAYLLEAERIVNRVVDDAERLRKLALGDRYDAVKLDDKMLAEAAEDFRQAKLHRQLRVAEEMKKVELEERLKLLSVEEKVLAEERSRLALAADDMLRRARRKFMKESDAARWLEQQKYDSDQAFIVDAERERLIRRRREFELGNSSNPGQPHLHPAPLSQSDVVLVMTVAIGGGREEVLTIREADDYRAVAATFARAHGLPPQVVDPLVEEVRKHARRGSAAGTPSQESVPRHSYRTPPAPPSRHSKPRDFSMSGSSARASPPQYSRKL